MMEDSKSAHPNAHLDENIDLGNQTHILILKKLLVLALLPADDIPLAFEWIRGAVPLHLGIIFGQYLRWYHQHIILGLSPQVISFFDRPQQLNDVTTQVPMNLAARVNTEVAPPWLLFRKTLGIAAASTRDLRRLREGGAAARPNITMSPRVGNCIDRTQILRLWNLHRNGNIANNRFLEVAANIVTEFVRIILFREEFRQGEFVPVFLPPPDDDIPDVENNGPAPNAEELMQELNFDELRALAVPEVAAALPAQNPAEGAGEVDGDITDEEEELDPMVNYEWRCSKCMVHKVEMISKPCNCVSLCRPCEQVVRQDAQDAQTPLICPACQERAVNYERVFMAETNDPDAPYDLRCQICEVNPLTSMGRHCHHLMICLDCVARIEETQLIPSCPFCRTPGTFTRVHFREALD